MNNPLSSVLGWLHKGYPDGVPPKDFYPLLALLARTLSDDEVDQIVSTLLSANPGEIRHQAVHDVIGQVKQAPPNQADVRDVASRLAAAGWPLGDPDTAPARLGEHSPARTGAYGQPESSQGESLGEQTDTAEASTSAPPTTGVVQRMIEWLDFGYPGGIPSTDRVPILALLRRRLTDDEVEQIARLLADEATGGSVAASAAEAMIARVTQEEPTAHELERVASRLAAKGWPLES